MRKAAPLFNQKGYAGTSLSDLMDATGLQKGGIYRHFSGKEELATEAFDYSWQKADRLRLAKNERPRFRPHPSAIVRDNLAATADKASRGC